MVSRTAVPKPRGRARAVRLERSPLLTPRGAILSRSAPRPSLDWHVGCRREETAGGATTHRAQSALRWSTTIVRRLERLAGWIASLSRELAHQAPSSQELTPEEERCTVYSQLSSCTGEATGAQRTKPKQHSGSNAVVQTEAPQRAVSGRSTRSNRATGTN
jgi:hypothetical protein